MCQFIVVGNQQQRRPVPFGEVEQHVHDLRARLAVEVAGWFVGKQQIGLGGEGSGDGDTLLFAAGELRRVMRQAVAETDRLEAGAGAVEGVAAARKFERHGDVFERRHGRHQVKGLEDDADLVAAEQGESILVQSSQVAAGDPHAAAGRAFEPADDHHHRGFSGA